MKFITYVVKSCKIEEEWFHKTHCDVRGLEIMLPKARFYAVMIYGIPLKEAIILKEEALARGMDCSLSRNVASLKAKFTNALIFGNERQFSSLIEKMKLQPFKCSEIAMDMYEALQNHKKEEYEIEFPRERMKIPPVRIMGILNITPDSFYDGMKYYDLEKAVERAQKMAENGADIIDVGGESTRPFAQEVSEEEEIKRILPVIEEISELRIPISVDTYKPEVAEKAIEAGAQMINDVSGLRNPKMLEVAKEYDVPVVIMHMRGKPKNMQRNPKYSDLFREIYGYLKVKGDYAAEILGKNKVLIDPGIGFGKTARNNYEIMKYIHIFKSAGYPILLGTSRKSFIGKVLDKPPEKRLFGTIATITSAVLCGVSVLRVHDVSEVKDAVRVAECILKPTKSPE